MPRTNPTPLPRLGRSAGTPNARARRHGSRALLACAVFAATALVCGATSADNTIKRPGDHPSYHVEIEPHLSLGSGRWDNYYAAGGYGVGVRFGIPVVDNGFVSTINNSVAISFGLDITHYDGCWYHGGCSANYLDFPVTMQWNFYVAQRWSVFGEPGLAIYHGFISDCPAGFQCPFTPTVTGIQPAFYVGGRYHFSDTTALTLRLGFPNFSFGFSFFP
ncbi:MAG: hypothetical protein M3O50_15855 [Myxococcota bacterium]|nr:hypothetical protein [Myxococcota bacterium]